jgi:prepilin-type N-terminal cleavage/methylation domain-containing protein
LKPRRGRSGFTLAEVAVTLVIVGIALVLVLQGLNTAKLTAAHTHQRKVARELALFTLGQVESGLYWEEVGDRLYGTYAEEGYPEFTWEVALGDDAFTEEEEGYGPYDSFRDRPVAEDEEEEDEDATEPFEKVRIRVDFPKLGELENTLTLERWIPWTQVYGEEEEDAEASDQATSDTGGRS